MPKIKYGADVLKKVLSMKHNGYKYSEIAKELNMNLKAVSNLCQRYRISEKKKEAKEEPKFPVDIKVDGKVVGTIKPMNDWVQEVAEKAKESIEPKPEKTLADFSARELIKRLYDLGYRIEGKDWNLYCLVKKPIILNDIIGV